MSEEIETRYCKNTKCHKVLPLGYRHKYCESCRNQHVDKTKGVLKGVATVGVAVIGVVVSIISNGKINPSSKA